MGFLDRLQHSWNAFMNKDPTPTYNPSYHGMSYSYRPDRPRFTRGNERSIVNAVYNRIAVDCAAIRIKHVKLDNEERYIETVNDGLNLCLNLEANIDQSGRDFIQNIVESLLDEGCVAVVPVDTTINPKVSGSYDIDSMRVGKIVEWFPQDVRVELYNDRVGRKQSIILPKSMVAIINNPFYSVMNEPNSTAQRLIRKSNILDAIDEQTGSGKLDLIIQLPYQVKTESRKALAEEKRRDIERQLSGSKYGVAYIDGTEHITQLNRSLENNLLKQIEYYTSMLYGQLGITPEIMNGTADENTMNNYYTRTIEPIMSAIVDEFKRKFLTKTARSQSHSIEFYRDPFKLVPVSNLADLADKFTRNEIMSSNEFRQIVGLHPSSDPSADELRNKNIAQSNEQLEMERSYENWDEVPNYEEEYQNG